MLILPSLYTFRSAVSIWPSPSLVCSPPTWVILVLDRTSPVYRDGGPPPPVLTSSEGTDPAILTWVSASVPARHRALHRITTCSLYAKSFLFFQMQFLMHWWLNLLCGEDEPAGVNSCREELLPKQCYQATWALVKLFVCLRLCGFGQSIYPLWAYFLICKMETMLLYIS